EPAERTLVGSLFIAHTLAGLAGCDRFTGISVSVVYQLEGVVRERPVHSHPRPPILNARSAIELKTDEAHTGQLPLPEVTSYQNVFVLAPTALNKITQRYILAKAQF